MGLGMYFHGLSVALAVVLPPGVNLYPSFSSLLCPLLPLFACAWCARACGGSVCASFPPSVVWASPAGLLPVPCAPVPFLASVVSFCLFVSLSSCSSCLSLSGLSFHSLSSPSFGPLLRFPCGFLGPLENQTLFYPTHENAIH